MFKKLRQEFIIINIFFSMLIFFATFIAIYLFMLNNISMKTAVVLKGILENYEDEELILERYAELPNCHVLSLDRDKKLRSVLTLSAFGNKLPQDMDFFQSLADECLKTENGYSDFRLDGSTWLYLRQEEAENTKIAVIDISNQIQTINQIMYTFVVIGSCGLFVIFILSYITIGRLIAPLNLAWDKQKKFLEDASHEFKTPLTIINTYLDLILKETDASRANQTQWVGVAQNEVVRMSKLIDNLLFLAKSDFISQRAMFKEIDLKELILTVATTVEAVIFEKRISFQVDADESIVINGDPEQIERLVMILIDNAIKHTTPSGTIGISLARQKKTAEIKVVNTGETIPSGDLPFIFDRFYKVDPSHTRAGGQIGGYGLGLSIAKTIVNTHRGMIKATSENSLNTFIVELPFPKKRLFSIGGKI